MRQVNEALGQQVGYAAELDEDELEAELAELDARWTWKTRFLQKEIEELEPGFTTQSKEEVVVMPDVPKMKAVPKMPREREENRLHRRGGVGSAQSGDGAVGLMTMIF